MDASDMPDTESQSLGELYLQLLNQIAHLPNPEERKHFRGLLSEALHITHGALAEYQTAKFMHNLRNVPRN